MYTDFITKKCDCFFTENLCIQILLQKSVTVFFTENLCIQIYYKKNVTVLLMKTYVYRLITKKCDWFFFLEACICSMRGSVKFVMRHGLATWGQNPDS